MAWLAIDNSGDEYIYSHKPIRTGLYWESVDCWENMVELPKGSIKKLIGRDLTWQDNPVELKEE